MRLEIWANSQTAGFYLGRQPAENGWFLRPLLFFAVYMAPERGLTFGLGQRQWKSGPALDCLGWLPTSVKRA